jgi:hypothetical protein
MGSPPFSLALFYVSATSGIVFFNEEDQGVAYFANAEFAYLKRGRRPTN